MKKTLIRLSAVLLLGIFTACDNGNGDGDQPDISPSDLNDKLLILVESGQANQWVFGEDAGTSGQARLLGAGNFSFTFTRTGANTSTLIFNVGGQDRYDMTWTSTTSGTFEQSFDGGATSSGTFTIEDAPEGAGSTNSFLNTEQKFGGAITQTKVTLVGAIANDFEVLDAGYWESGASIRFVNGIISLRYLNSNTVMPTAVTVTLKDVNGNVLGLKIPTVDSESELQYTLLGGSTFLKNSAPLSFSFIENADLGGGVSVSGTVTSTNNHVYAQGSSGRDIVHLIQILRQGAGRDFPGNFDDLAEVELSYFTQVTGVNNNNAYVVQRYFDNNSPIIEANTGSFTLTQAPTFDAANETWTFQVTNDSQSDDNLSFDFILRSNGTGVANELETNVAFTGGETKTFEISKDDLNSSLSFLSATEIQNLSAKVLLDW